MTGRDAIGLAAAVAAIALVLLGWWLTPATVGWVLIGAGVFVLVVMFVRQWDADTDWVDQPGDWM